RRGRVRRRAGAEARARRAQEVDRVDLEAALVARTPERLAHRELLERREDLRRIAPLQARPEAAVGLEVPLGGIEVHDEEDAAEEPQQVVELVEDLLEEEVV